MRRRSPLRSALREHPVVLFTGVLFMTVWFVVLVGWGDLFLDNKYRMPHVTWLLLWLLIAVCAGPVFWAICRSRRYSRPVHRWIALGITFALPPAVAMHLLDIAGRCAGDMCSIAGSCGFEIDTCPSHPVTRGWIGLWVGFVLLLGAAFYVLALGHREFPATDFPRIDPTLDEYVICWDCHLMLAPAGECPRCWADLDPGSRGISPEAHAAEQQILLDTLAIREEGDR